MQHVAISVSTLMAIMDTVEDMYSLYMYGTTQLLTWKVNLQMAYMYNEDLVSFWKDRVLFPNALQQVTVGLQCTESFSLLTQKGTNLQQNYSSLNNMCFSI